MIRTSHPIQRIRRHRSLRVLSTAATIGIISALAAPAPSFAVTDDTEVFSNPFVKVPNRPNVLLILDTSGSMSTTVAGTGKSRLQNMKDALQTILQGSSAIRGKINAGLVHFDGLNLNHPIYYPVAPLDAAATAVEPSVTTTGAGQVADRILDLVNSFQAQGFTPIVPTLYEAVRYFKGDTVDLGKTEVVDPNGQGAHGVSHQATVTGGTFTPAGCVSARDRAPNNNPTNNRCTAITGSPTYISPLTTARDTYFNEIDLTQLPAGNQATGLLWKDADGNAILRDGTKLKPVKKPTDCVVADYIIFLTDGEPTYPDGSQAAAESTFRNNAWTLSGHSGTAACVGSAGGNEGRCGVELAKFLHQPTGASLPVAPATGTPVPGDLSSGLAGKQWAILHTIGFNLGNNANAINYLRQLATAGGGQFYEATDANSLVGVFARIFTQVISGSGSGFATPRFATQAFNRLFSGDEVYVSLFKPSAKSRWNGNVKKYRACTELITGATFSPPTTATWNPTSKTCTVGGQTVAFGTILDNSGSTLVETLGANAGRIRPTASDLWSTTIDGENIEAGGAGAKLLARLSNVADAGATRNLYTFTGVYDATGRIPADPALATLSAAGNALTTTNTALTDAMFTQPNGPTVAKDPVITWIRNHGPDVNDDDNDTNKTELLWPFDDPMHASAVPIQYGLSRTAATKLPSDPTCTDADTTNDAGCKDTFETLTKVFVPGNAGGLRMLNGGNDSAGGNEEWMFIPKELLPLQKVLMDNGGFKLPLNTRPYGLDGSPVILQRDQNDNGVTTDSGDFVRLVLGQRDGGRRYYAIDVTAAGTVAATATVQPKLLWKIDPDSDASFADLANTWSRPTPARLRLGEADATGNPILTDVLIFGGGNDTLLNDQFGPAPATPIGARKGNAVFIVRADTGALLSKIGGNNAADGAPLLADMTYPVPSNITAFDSDGDQATDRLYFGDIGGNVWRSDITTSGTAVNPPDTRRIATLAGPTDPIVPNAGAPIPLTNDDPATPAVNETSATSKARAFYFAPEVVRIDNAQFGGRFDLVVIASGHSAHPLDNTVQNAIYAIKDRHVFPFASYASVTGIPVQETTLVDLTSRPLQKSETGALIVDATITQTTIDTTLSELKTGDGWKIFMLDIGPAGTPLWRGEKAYSQPVVIGGKLFYTSYIPPTVAEMQAAANPDVCRPADGHGRLNARDLLTGGAVFAQWDVSDSTSNPDGSVSNKLNRKDPTFVEHNGPPPSEIGFSTIGRGTPGGSTNGTGGDVVGTFSSPLTGFEAGGGPPRGRIYWYER